MAVEPGEHSPSPPLARRALAAAPEFPDCMEAVDRILKEMPSIACPVVVGREPELMAIVDALSRAIAGAGGVMYVVGEAGIGKSRLAHEAATLARSRGMRVLRGRAVDGGGQIPFRPFAEAFQSEFRLTGPPRAPAIDPFRIALGKVVPDWARGRPVDETNPIVLLEGIVRLLDHVGAKSGALVILEDLHWSDTETLFAVDYLVDNLTAARVLCLVTGRTDEPTTSGGVLRRMALRFPASLVSLRRLAPGEIAEMVSVSLGQHTVPDDLVTALARRSEGVPLLVEEMLSAYAESLEGAGDAAAAVRGLPLSYATIVAQRVALLDADGRSVLQAAAALGSDLDARVLATMTGLPKQRVLEAIRAGLRASLLVEERTADGSRVVFRHALVADAVLADLLPAERSELYERSADAVERQYPGLPGEWCERVADLRLRAGDRLRAFSLLVEAGRRALKRSALLTAEQTLERARELAQGDRWRTTGVDRVLVRALSALAKTDRMRELAQSALDFMEESPDLMGTPERTGDLQLQVAAGLASARRWDAAAEQMKTVERLVERAGDEQLRSRARSLDARVLFELGRYAEAEQACEEALRSGRQLNLPDVICEALCAMARQLLRMGDIAGAATVLHDAKLIAERRDLTLARVNVLLHLASLDETTSASTANIEAAARLVGVTEAPLTHVLVDLHTARLRAARFELGAAEESVRRALQTCRRYSLPLLPATLSVQAEAAALRGERAAVQAAVREARSSGQATRSDDTGLAGALAVSALVAGDRKKAAEALDGMEPEPWGPHSWYAGLAALLRVLDAGPSTVGATADGPGRGRASRAAEPTAREEVATAAGAFHELCRAVRAGRAGETAAADESFRRADRWLEPFPWRQRLARRLVAEAAITDRWGRPTHWLEDSLSFFQSAAQPALASACTGLLRRSGARVRRNRPGTAPVPPPMLALGITSREMEVLSLLAEGLSNQAIADRLYLSVRTVESHVASAMRKTHAESRTALVAYVLERTA